MLRKKNPCPEASQPSRFGTLSALVTFIASCAIVSSAGPAPAQDKPAKPKRAPQPVDSQPGGAAQQGTDSVRDELLKINYIFNRELYELALPRYEKLLEANSGYARADLIHYPVALCHYNLAVKNPADGKKKPPDATDSEQAAGPADAAGKEHLKQCVAHLKESLKRKEFESRSEATRLLGQCLLLLEDYEGAAKTFQWVLDHGQDGKDSGAAALGLAETLYLQAKYPQAAEAYRKVIEKAPAGDGQRRAELYLAMSLYRAAESIGGEAGGAERRAKALDESLPLFEKAAAAKSPYAEDARYMLALARQAKGDVDGAIEAFRKLAASGSRERSELAQFGLASALFRAGKHKEAAVELQKFLDAFPSSDRRDAVSLYLARSMLETAQTGPAAKMLQDLRASASAGDEASLWLARIYAQHGKARSAVSVLSAALKAFPKSSLRESLELELASAQLADGNFDAAGEALSRIETTGPSAGSAEQIAYLKAYALHRAKKFAESEAACEKLEKSFPESRYSKDVAQLEAENKLLSGDPAAAFEAYQAYLKRYETALDAPSRLKARFRSAQALYLGKKYREARDLLDALRPADLGPEAERVFGEDAVFATYQYQRGDCSYQLKDSKRAREELGAFLKEIADGSARMKGLDAEASDARFKAAHSLQLDGNLSAAAAAYGRLLEEDPKSPHREQTLFELGQMAYTGKDNAAASGWFEKVLAENPSSRFAPHALRFLGWIAFDAKDFAAAAEKYRKVAEAYPGHPLAAESELQLALCLRSLGKADEASAAIARFKEKHPDDPRLARILFDEAATLSKAGKHREALDALEKLRGEPPAPEMLPSILYEIAWCHRGLSDVDSAAKDYEQIFQLKSPGALGETARLELAELDFDRKEYARAKELLAPLVAGHGPHREKALYRLVWCCHMLDDAAGVISAHDDLHREFAASPLAPELGVLVAKAHLKNGDHAKAGEIFRAIGESGAGGLEVEVALVSYGECLVEDKKFDEAKRRFTAFLERYPKSDVGYRARFGRGWAAENLGKLDEAVEAYRQVAKESVTPIGARAQFQIGQCLAAKKQWKDAIVELLQVPARFSYPEWSAKALLQVAGCFEALEDAANARKYYAEVDATYPDRDEAKLARERLHGLETN